MAAEKLPDRTEEAQQAETLTLEGPVFTRCGTGPGAGGDPGAGWKAVPALSRWIRQASQGGLVTYASVTVPYVLEGRQEPPETAWVTLTDEQTGQEYEREIPRLEMEETSASGPAAFSSWSQCPAMMQMYSSWGTWKYRRRGAVLLWNGISGVPGSPEEC